MYEFGSGKEDPAQNAARVRTRQCSVLVDRECRAPGRIDQDDQDNVEQYNLSGVLQSITSRNGVTQTLSYSSTTGQLASVVDSFGHSLAFSYNTWGAISAVTVNGGASVQYRYAGPWRTLSMVTNLDGTTRSYQYTDNNHPTSLTGYVDEQGTTQTTWAYDTQNRATATQDAGGANAVSLTYNTNGTVTKTDALGAVLTLSYQWIGDLNHLIAISGSQCPSCREPAATTYDAAGCVSSRADYNGNLTCYANYAARGLELIRVEGFAPGSTCPANLASYAPVTGTRQRKISTTWNATFLAPASVTEANRTTSFTYDTSGNALTKTVTDTSVTPNVARTWTYTYDSLRPRVDRRRSAHGRIGRDDVHLLHLYDWLSVRQLHSLTNAASQITTYNTYNAYGQPLTPRMRMGFSRR